MEATTPSSSRVLRLIATARPCFWTILENQMIQMASIKNYIVTMLAWSKLLMSKVVFENKKKLYDLIAVRLSKMKCIF